MGCKRAGGSLVAVLLAALWQVSAVAVEPAKAMSSTIPAASTTLTAVTPSAVVHLPRHKNEAQFRAAKAGANAAASRATGPSAGAPAAPRPAAAIYNGTNFSGLSAGGTETPSDSTGDASPTQQVEFVNSAFAVYPIPCGPCGPATGGLYNMAGASPSDCIFDPQVAWDQQWGRWIYAMLVQHSSAPGGCTGETNSNITDDKLVIGWTYTSDANDFAKSNVCLDPIDTGSNLLDFPKLGHDNNSLIVGANVFSNYGAGSFTKSVVWIMSKPAHVSLSNPCGIGWAAIKVYSLGATVFTPVPADMTDSSSVDYVVAAQFPGAGTANNLLVWQSSASSTSQSLTFVGYFGVAPFAVPPDIPQPSTGASSCATAGNCLDAGDSRLTQAIGHYDPDAGHETIWTQHAITDPRFPARSIERWYEIVPATHAVRQSGNVSDPTLHIFDGAVSPTAAGNEATIFYNAGNSTVNGFVSYRAQSRNRVSALGGMFNETLLAASTANDADFSCGSSLNPPVGNLACRWGDFSAARPDPSNPNAVWGFGMLTGSGGSTTSAGWATQIAEVTPGCSAVSVSAARISANIAQFTAAGAVGCSNPEYQFWLQPPNGSWQIVQPFSTNNVWNWNTTGYRPGTYNIDVWANQSSDSTAGAESLALTTWSIAACSSVGVSPNLMSPQPSGTQVILTAASGGCPNPNPQYEFWLLPPGGPWTVVQHYSATATFNWDTTGDPPGNYDFSAWVRDATSSGAFGTPPNTYDAFTAFNFALQPAPCTGMSASASPASTTTIGTPVGVTGAASGCPNPRYQFWLLPPGGGWKIVQPYSAGATFTWSTTGMPAGLYRFSVWARDASSANVYDTFNAFAYSLTVAPCTGMSASTAPPTTAVAGTIVTVTGSATGCPNPQYKFWLLSPGGTWTVVQPYSGTATFTWTTASKPPGSYRFSVWARDASSASAYDSFSAFAYTLT